MKTIIKKPTCITVYEYKELFRVEVHAYNVKEEKPTHLLEVVNAKTEEEMVQLTNQLKEKYEVKEFYRNLFEDEEIEYVPHDVLKMYEWTPKELSDVLKHYFLRVYGYDAGVLVEYDQYKGYFNVRFEVADDGEGYDEFYERIMDDFLYDNEQERRYHIDWNQLFERIMHDMIGSKLIMVKPTEDSVYETSEYTWREDKDPAYFFFR